MLAYEKGQIVARHVPNLEYLVVVKEAKKRYKTASNQALFIKGYFSKQEVKVANREKFTN